MALNRNTALEYAAEHKKEFINSLCDFVKIPSISTDPERKEDMLQAANWLMNKLEILGFETRLIPTEGHPVVFAERSVDPAYPTILLYGHYDVQPAEPLDLWTSPPFEPEVRNDSLFGRGTSDMKGQVVACMSAVESILNTTPDIQLNIKWIVEGEEEIGSPSLTPVLEEYQELLQNDVVLNTDSGMIGRGIPTITYGLRGLAYFELRVFGPESDLHSGIFGGVVHNPALALCRINCRHA